MLHVVFSQDLHFKNCILLSTLQCRYSGKLTSQLENREDDLKFLFEKKFCKIVLSLDSCHKIFKDLRHLQSIPKTIVILKIDHQLMVIIIIAIFFRVMVLSLVIV